MFQFILVKIICFERTFCPSGVLEFLTFSQLISAIFIFPSSNELVSVLAKIVTVFIIIYYRLRRDFLVFQITKNSQEIITWDFILSQLRGAIEQQSAGYKDNIEEFFGSFFVNKLWNKSS